MFYKVKWVRGCYVAKSMFELIDEAIPQFNKKQNL